jgi:hypothetical protein
MAPENFRPRSCGLNIYSQRGAFLTPDCPRWGFPFSFRRARMPSEGLRGDSEGSSIGPWERALSPDSA